MKGEGLDKPEDTTEISQEETLDTIGRDLSLVDSIRDV